MNETSVLITSGAGLVGFGLGLAKDIIMTWIKGGRGDSGQQGKKDKECAEHETRTTVLETEVAALKEAVKDTQRKIGGIYRSLSEIDKSLAILADRSDREVE